MCVFYLCCFISQCVCGMVWCGVCARERSNCLPACCLLSPLSYIKLWTELDMVPVYTNNTARVCVCVYMWKIRMAKMSASSSSNVSGGNKTVQDAHHFHFDYFVRLCIFYETCWCMTIPVWLLSCLCLMNIYMYNMYMRYKIETLSESIPIPCVYVCMCAPPFVYVYLCQCIFCISRSQRVSVCLSELNVIPYTCENLKMNIMADA